MAFKFTIGTADGKFIIAAAVFPGDIQSAVGGPRIDQDYLPIVIVLPMDPRQELLQVSGLVEGPDDYAGLNRHGYAVHPIAFFSSFSRFRMVFSCTRR